MRRLKIYNGARYQVASFGRVNLTAGQKTNVDSISLQITMPRKYSAWTFFEED
jgi:hypothetical protein